MDWLPSFLSYQTQEEAKSVSTVDTHLSNCSYKSQTSSWRDKVLPFEHSSSLSSEPLSVSEAMLALYDPDYEGNYDYPLIDEGTAYLCSPGNILDAFDGYYTAYPERGQAYRGETPCS